MKMITALSAATATAIVAAAAAQPTTVYGVTDDQTLVSFDASTPGTIANGIAISGLAANESIRGIDFRPADGQLYALGSFSNLYTINLATGAATNVGGGSFFPSLNGSSFGFDFNPTIDRIRVVSDADQNLVVNPNDGSATEVTPLFYNTGDVNEGQDPNVVSSAYTNSFAGSTSTQLYGIDTGLDVLVRQANSAGTLDTVGSLGVDLNDLVGFDIDGRNNDAFAAVFDATLFQTTFWSIDLGTGAATQIGPVGGGARLTSIAVVGAVPAPGAAGLLALGGLAAVRRRR